MIWTILLTVFITVQVLLDAVLIAAIARLVDKVGGKK